MSLPGFYCCGLFDLNKRWLNCFKITLVPMIAQVLGTVLHVYWCYLFIEKLDYGVEGLGYATSITYFIQFFVITVNTCLIPKIRDCVFFPTIESFSGWYDYFRLSVPATVMLCAEWWSFHVMVFLSGSMGVNEQAAVVISLSFYTLVFMIPMGMQEAFCALIGNEIGANNPKLAKK